MSMDTWTKEEVLEALRGELEVWQSRAAWEADYASLRYWEGNKTATKRAIELIEKMEANT